MTEATASESPGMEAASDNLVKDFLNTGRTGRRNAIPDVLAVGAAGQTSTAGLPEALERLVCSDTQPGSSAAQNPDVSGHKPA